METIKKGNKSIDVLSLQCSLGCTLLDGVFGEQTEKLVKTYQKSHGLEDDGIVGQGTWRSILAERKKGISDETWKRIAKNLGVEVAMIKAIYSVESSGASYLASGYPALLFEAHIFYRELKKIGKNPETLIKNHPSILSKTWNKNLYKGGQREVPRINEAWAISPGTALMSASFGAFQICGFNYKLCGCKNVYEFYREMWISEERQLELLGKFLKGLGIVPYMKSKNFSEIARRYNGSGYKQNKYDTKLKNAYLRYTQN